VSASHAPAPTSDAAAILSVRLGAGVSADLALRQDRALGGVVPSLVARPADAAELVATVAAVAAADGALVPLGRGAHRGLGHPPSRYDLALVTDRLARVRDYTPADMTVTVEAGVTLADLAMLLAREGQWLPIEAPLPAETTVGGLLAADLGGSLAASQGRVRDFAIGIEVVTAAGVPARAGGRVVKNVAGYDLMKLFIGSLGTLAVLTEVTLKVRPRPEEQRCLVFATRGTMSALAFGAAIAAARLEVLAVTTLGDVGANGGGPEARESDATIVVRLGGTGADVGVSRARVMALAESHAAALVLDADHAEPAAAASLERGRDFPARAAGDLVVRLALLPSRVPALAEELGRIGGVLRGACQGDPLHGLLTLALATEAPASVLAALARVADAHGAHLIVERWPLVLAPAIDVWRPLPPALPLMRRMKAALDPRGTLACGRFVGRL
jgi:glycolate oxidase FAD binding subunit